MSRMMKVITIVAVLGMVLFTAGTNLPSDKKEIETIGGFSLLPIYRSLHPFSI